MTERAYSIFKIKSFDDEKRILRGIATTPAMDREGDIVLPEGAEFKLPIPFLWQHNQSQPIGKVIKADVTTKGIMVEVQIAMIQEAGALKERLDEAWQSIKSGLVQGLSIGFAGREFSRLENGGRKFLKWAWLELSAVTIPANAEATITSVKSADKLILNKSKIAASGKKAGQVQITEAASGHERNAIKGESIMAKTLLEQLAASKATLEAKNLRMGEILGASEGSTLDETAQEEFDAVSGEAAELKSHIARIEKAIDASQSSAITVSGKSVEDAAASRDSKAPRITVRQNTPPVEKGIRFARALRIKGLALIDENGTPAHVLAERHYSNTDPELVAFTKAAVSAHTSGNMAALIGNDGGFADFVEFLRPQTILGKFGTAGIPALRRIPFRVPLVSQASAGNAQWVGEGKGKPLTGISFTRTQLEPAKVAAISVATMELLRDSSPSAEAAIRDDLAMDIVQREDITFGGVAAGVANVRPAGIGFGVAGTASAGATADNARADARTAMGAFVAANNPLADGVWIMSGSNALALSLMVNALGQPEFTGITVNGGRYFGLPVIISNHVGTNVFLVKASDIWLADDGGIDVRASTEASLEMVDNPTLDSAITTPATAPVATSLVSMFQTNSVAFRAERTINWAPRRAGAVSLLTGVAYAP